MKQKEFNNFLQKKSTLSNFADRKLNTQKKN